MQRQVVHRYCDVNGRQNAVTVIRRKQIKLGELFTEVGDRDLVREILSYVCDISLGQVFLLQEIDNKVAKQVICVANEVKNGVPLAYAVGKTWFFGLPFVVNEHVLVPRNDTETLIETVLSWCRGIWEDKKNKGSIRILDMCTGSGCIAVAVKKNFDEMNIRSRVVAIDISEKALDVARKNAKLNEVDVEFIQSDLFKNVLSIVGGDKFDVIVSNPPYVRTGDIGVADKTVLKEPWIALDGGEDGLEFYRRIISEAVDYLVDGGGLFVEVGFDQGFDVAGLFVKHGYSNISVRKDMENRDRVVYGKFAAKPKEGSI